MILNKNNLISKDRIMDVPRAQKYAVITDLSISIFTVLLAVFFKVTGVNIMFVTSVICFFLDLSLLILISKGYLIGYIWFLYIIITVFMDLGTLCLGFDAGFALYSIGMLPILYYLDYASTKMHGYGMNANYLTGLIIGTYFISTFISVKSGAIYQIAGTIKAVTLILNSACVFTYIIGYTILMNRIIAAKERDLSNMAMLDQLTGLYNRHYISDLLEEKKQSGWALSILDIDDFKKINDTYGHNCGDFVLKQVANILSGFSDKCMVARWGGEEILILGNSEIVTKDFLERIRSKIAEKPFAYDEKNIPVTVTIGAARYEEGLLATEWIQKADDKLYYGKSHGKNQVNVDF